MKKLLICVLSIVLCLLMISCGKAEIKNKIEGNLETYYEMTDGSWTCGDYFSPEDAVLVEMKTD